MQMQNATMATEVSNRSVMTSAGRPRQAGEDQERGARTTERDERQQGPSVMRARPSQLDQEMGRGTTIDTMA